MPVKQKIHQANNVAGRDLLIVPHSERTEAELQKAFMETTGIWCSSLERHAIEALLKSGDINLQDISRARKAGVLAWNVETKALEIKYKKVSRYFNYTVFALIFVLFAIAAIEIMQSYEIHKWPDNLIIITSLGAYGIVIYGFYHFGILPSHSAARLSSHLGKKERP